MEQQNNVAEETSAPTLMNDAIKWGVIVGVVSMVIQIVMYVVDYTLMVQLKMLFLSLAIYFGMTIYAGIQYRNQIGGYMTYGQAFMHGFMILAVSGLLATIFGILLSTVIDPELPQKLTDASMENTRAMMENFGAPADKIDEELEKARARTENQFTLSGRALGYIFILVFSAIMAAITALIVRKKEPEI